MGWKPPAKVSRLRPEDPEILAERNKKVAEEKQREVETSIGATNIASPWWPVGQSTTNGVLTNSYATNTSALRCGIEKVTFVKVKYDSWLGTTFHPVTNNYTVTIVTNGPAALLPGLGSPVPLPATTALLITPVAGARTVRL